MNNPNTTHRKFLINFHWALAGSITYELLKTAHNLMLLNILDKSTYGKFGSITAIIFMLYRFTEFGLTTTLAPFFSNFLESKQNFKNLLFKYYLLPHLPLQIIVILLLPMFCSRFLSCNPSLKVLMVIGILILLETVRSFFRILLHISFHSKEAMMAELSGMLIYLGGIWGPIILFKYRPTLINLFIPFAIDSIFSLSLLIWLTKKYIYSNLPENDAQINSSLKKRIIKTRIVNHFLKVSREIFASNFLTPFFALKFGFSQAGIFYIASSISYSLNAIFRGTLTYPGAALLAATKTRTQAEKKSAFALLSQKLTMFVAPPIIFLLINAPHIIKISKNLNLTASIISIATIFFVITFSEFFFMLYEQFYIIEEESKRFLLFKLIEFSLFYFLILKTPQTSILYTLINIIFIKIISFTIIASDAYFRWKINLHLKTSKRELVIIIFISFITYIILSLSI